MRRVIVALIAVALAVAVFVLWPRSDGENPSDPQAGPTTTTTTLSATTTTAAVSTTTSWPTSTVTDVQVVETVEEAEAILRDLWFGWFEGIYNQDEARIREVVILEETVETARASFGTEFERAPEPTDINFSETEILRADGECLAVSTDLILTGFRTGRSSGVEVIRWTTDGWKSLSTWSDPNDLWEADCESSL